MSRKLKAESIKSGAKSNERRKSLVLVHCSLFLLCSFIYSCTVNPNIQGKGDERLQGTWVEDSLSYRSTLLSYTHHGFTFTCDSVYAQLTTYSRTNIYPDSCFNKGVWNEYAKGTYGVKNDTIYLLATYTRSNYKQKLSGCYNIGQYLPVFIIRKQVADTLYMDNLQSHVPVKLIRTQKTVCQPKAL